MKLVIDANVFFAAVITGGRQRRCWALDALFSENVEYFAPFRLLVELERHQGEIQDKTKFSSRDFEAFIQVLKMRVEFIPLEEFQDKIPEALEVAPHNKDAEYFALALKNSCGILSTERAFKQQSKVKVFTPEELIEELKPP